MNWRPGVSLLLFFLAARVHAAPVATDRTSEIAVLPTAGAPARGPDDALVTVELFCNFAHVQCAAADRMLKRVAERNPDGLRVIYRQVVLPFRDSQTVATAAVEAFRQGRFLELADAVAARPGPVRARDLEAVAARAGLDLDALRAALGDERHVDHLERDALRREALGIGTIGLAWNGEPAPTPDLSLESALRSYARAHARAVARLGAGVPRAELFATLSEEAQAERAGGRATARVDAGAPRARVPIGDAPVRGDAGAPVTIVVFTDFECTFCRRQAEILRKLLPLYPDKVRIVYKHFPLSRGGSSRAAADAAECARRQGRFWEMHDLLIDGPIRRRERELDDALVAAGVDPARARADLPACQARVDADVAAGKALGVESTPTLFVNGIKLVGMRGLAELRLHIEDELAPGILGKLVVGSR